ncbi:hypothetical protein BGW42_000709 [Actinomortierella wolfii]|nr:hypothetical protein BGW42_000709 [Actinomortierella wolfii]
MDDNESSPATTTERHNVALAARLDAKERELLEREIRLNEAVDAKLHDRIERDPRPVWLVYALQFFSDIMFTFVAFTYSPQFGRRSSAIGVKYNDMYVAMAVCAPLLAGILSDSYLGKWWSLLSSIIVLLAATIAMTVVTVPHILSDISEGLLLFFLGVFIFSIRYFRTITSAFGGDQFLAIQERGLARYFALLYFFSEAASVIFTHSAVYLQDAQCPWEGIDLCYLYDHIIMICSALVCLIVLLVARRRFRVVPPLRSFVPFTVIKMTFVAAKRYSAASPGERAAKGQWLNFAAEDYGSLFVQEVYDFALALVPTVLPVTFLSGLADYTDTLYAFETSAYVRDNNGATATRSEFSSQVSTYSLLAFILLLFFVIFPLCERRGIVISPYRRFGAGYVCALVAYALTLIVNKVSKDIYNSGMRLDGPEEVFLEEGIVCEDCVHFAATIPQYLCVGLAYALAIPAGAQIVYTECGRHLRAFAVAIFLVFQTGILHALKNSFTTKGRVSDMNKYLEKVTILYGVTGAIGFILYLVVMRFYTPRKNRTAINDAAALAKDAEFVRK